MQLFRARRPPAANTEQAAIRPRAPGPVDPFVKAPYIAVYCQGWPIPLNKIRMCANESENTGLEALEARVEELIDMLERLKSENSALRTERESLLQERAMLTEQTEQARRRVESIISRLSALEIHS